MGHGRKVYSKLEKRAIPSPEALEDAQCAWLMRGISGV